MVQPILLPSLDDVINTFEDQKLLMASWGHYSDESVISETLRSVEMETIPLLECSAIFPPQLVSSSVICTKDSHCSGDSGSMLVKIDHNGNYVAVAIASFSYGVCEEGRLKPSVFMRIASYLDFIRHFIELIDD